MHGPRKILPLTHRHDDVQRQIAFSYHGALATFERDLIRERTRAGLAAARAAGRIGGRRRLLTPEMIETVQTLAANPKLTKPMIAAKLKISVPTLYRALFAEPTENKQKSPRSGSSVRSARYKKKHP